MPAHLLAAFCGYSGPHRRRISESASQFCRIWQYQTYRLHRCLVALIEVHAGTLPRVLDGYGRRGAAKRSFLTNSGMELAALTSRIVSSRRLQVSEREICSVSRHIDECCMANERQVDFARWLWCLDCPSQPDRSFEPSATSRREFSRLKQPQPPPLHRIRLALPGIQRSRPRRPATPQRLMSVC